jgi:hypothetical protein
VRYPPDKPKNLKIKIQKREKKVVPFDRKSPPFPPEAGEGWGTFKDMDWAA